MFDSLQKQAQEILRETFSRDINELTFTFPATPEFGDISTAIAFELAKKEKTSPKTVAEKLARAFGDVKGVRKAEVAGAGYVNVWLEPSVLLEALSEAQGAVKKRDAKKEAKQIIVEYCSPNIAKPLGVHHLLTMMIGQVLANLYDHAGLNVVRWNYVGDWGTQYGKLVVAYQKWGKEADPKTMSLDEMLNLYVKFHNEAEKDTSLEAQAQEAFKKLEQGDAELRSLWSAFVGVTVRTNTPIFRRLSVHFDTHLGESDYETAMAPILEEGMKKGVFVPGDRGATIVRFPDETKMPPALVLKADGATNYLTRDLALARDRIDRYNPTHIFHVVDVAQSLHFAQLFATAKLLKWKLPHWEHISFGRMRFADRSMSTRKGNVLKLEEVLDEAVKRADALIAERGDSIQTDEPKDLAEMMGIGSIVYGVLSQNRVKDIVFDWDKMLSFEGNSAPYLQYTHARARSVLRKAKEEKIEMHNLKDVTISDSDRPLLLTMLRFPSVLEDARESHMPHTLANYLFELCQRFNTFYNTVPILKSEGSERSLRLQLTSVVADILKCGAGLLTFRVPERM